MKNVKVFFPALVILLILTRTGFAQPVLQLEEGRQNDLLTVRVADLNKKYATIKVSDLSGKIWLSKQLWNKDEYTAGFDLSELTDGDYLVMVKSKGVSIVKPFTRICADLIFLQPKEMQSIQPEAVGVTNGQQKRTGQLIARISQPENGKAIDIQLANLKGGTTSVGLISVGGISAIREEISGNHGYSRRFSLEGMEGQYILYIKTAEVSIMQFLEVNEKGVQLLHALSREKQNGESVLVASR